VKQRRLAVYQGVLSKLLPISASRLRSACSTLRVTDLHPNLRDRKGLGLFLTLPILAVALLATACGGGTTKTAASASTTTTPSGSTGAAAFAKYTTCLESHGVPSSIASSTFGFGRRRPTSSTTAGGTSASSTRPTIPSQYQAAYTTCRSTLPAGGFAGRGNFNSAQLQAYRNCLTLHGVTIPTTAAGSQGSGGGFGGGGFGAVSSSPAFKAAQLACANLLPARPTGSTTTLPASS
jgi:hypothetical protein